MTDPSYTALRAYHRAVNGMLEDPDVTGDLLLIGMWMARVVHLGIPTPGTDGWGWKAVCTDIYGGTGRNELHRLTRALRDDIPRYDPHRDRDSWGYPTCSAPMIRRKGACGQQATKEQLLTELATGLGVFVGACSRHRSWLDGHLLDNRQQVKALGDHLPRPPANCGGVLARHIPRGIGWRKLWLSLDLNWAPTPTATPAPRPRFELLTFEPDADDLPEAAGAERPTFTVVKGGWT